MNGMNSSSKYIPSSPICTEPFDSKYAVQEDIGRGKFAVVRKCVSLETGEIVAAKVIRKRRKGKSCREEILREVVMLELAMAHPRLVSLREVFETQSELILVTEYCSGGELFNECVINESFKENDVRKLLVQILEGLAYLHDNNIVHLDLKPQNILLTKPFPDGDVKICDLGFACLTNTGEDIRDIIGTPDYVAPEVLDYEPLNIQTDMWSLGVLTYVMLTTYSPFAGDNQQETFCNITQIKMDYPDELFEGINPLAKDFISKLLVKKPRDRLTARECLDHPWLASLKDTMTIQVPTPDHSQELAHDMVAPSNWHMSPDRKNSTSSNEILITEQASVANGCSIPECAPVAPTNKSTSSGSSNRTSISEEKDFISSTLSNIDIDRSSCTSFETCPEDISPAESITSCVSSSNTPDDTTLAVFASEVAESATRVAANTVASTSNKVKPSSLQDLQHSHTSKTSNVCDSSISQAPHHSHQRLENQVSSPTAIAFPDVLSRQRDSNKLENAGKRMSMEIPPKKAKCIEESGDVTTQTLEPGFSSSACNVDSSDPSHTSLDNDSSASCNGIDVRNAV